MKAILKFLFAISVLINTYSAFAQISICGDPPPVANETLKGEIKGKAQFISKYLGDAELSGKIETSRTEIFSKYGDAETSRSNAYFEYQMCILIFADKKMKTQEKIEELKKVKREFQKPAVKRVSSIGQSSALLRSAFPTNEAMQKSGCDEALKEAISALTCLGKYVISSKSCPQMSGSPRTYIMRIDVDCMV